MLFANCNLPTHLLVGTRKSATSWIWKQFSDHPDVFVPTCKELYFFNKFYDNGLGWYKLQFNTKKKKILDTTPDYFFEECAERIKKDIPNAKIFVCLRNPIDRAYSHWKFATFLGNCDKSFMSAWDNDWNRLRTRGLYDQHIKAYTDRFKCLVMLYDDLIDGPVNFMNEIYDFVGVSRHRSKFFEKKWMPGEISNNGMEKSYEKISNQKMSIKERDLLFKYYKSSILKTEDILNKTTGWLNENSN